MQPIGLFFASSTGNTRRIAKAIKKRFDDQVMAAACNVNKATPEQFSAYTHLILGSSTLGAGQLPGRETDCMGGGWAEFLPLLADSDFTGKTIALFGFGNQDKYPDEFADALGELYHFFVQRGAKVVGQCSTEGYDYLASRAEVDGEFVGLVLDHENQKLLTDARVAAWLALIQLAFELPIEGID